MASAVAPRASFGARNQWLDSLEFNHMVRVFSSLAPAPPPVEPEVGPPWPCALSSISVSVHAPFVAFHPRSVYLFRDFQAHFCLSTANYPWLPISSATYFLRERSFFRPQDGKFIPLNLDILLLFCLLYFQRVSKRWEDIGKISVILLWYPSHARSLTFISCP